MSVGGSLDLQDVHCRVGSLEKHQEQRIGNNRVHCRVGSLENDMDATYAQNLVHCRVGSLESGKRG